MAKKPKDTTPEEPVDTGHVHNEDGTCAKCGHDLTGTWGDQPCPVSDDVE